MKESVIPFKRETDCHTPDGVRNDEEWGKRIAARLAAVSPAGSVGASASQRCPPDTRTAMTKAEKRISAHISAFAAAPKAAAPAGAAGSVEVTASVPGKICKIEAAAGTAVKAGDAVLVLEAMKMEIPVVAPQDGTVATINVAVGDAVESGDVLATMN